MFFSDFVTILYFLEYIYISKHYKAMRKFALFIFLYLSGIICFAGHRAGGEYTWQCINDSTYVITYIARVDCAHNYDPKTKYCLLGSLPGDPNNGTYTVDSSYNIDFVVPFCPTLPTCQNGGFYNWQSVSVYSDTIVLQQPISPWYTIQHCDGGNRPNADNTNGSWYVEANFSIVVPCNSSPVATSYHDVIFCIGDSAVIQNDFIDPDGDSLVFYLTNCLDGPGQSLTYNPPFTPTNPLTSSTGWTIDSVGNISFLPTIILHGTVCLMIEEWRNGVLISNNIQDMYINFVDCQYTTPGDTPVVNDIVVVDEGCTGMIYTSGFEESSIVYNSIFPGPIGTYNSYLSCLNGCDTTFVTAQLGYPPFIDFQVCGVPNSGCDIITVVCDTVRVYFYSSLGVQINPVNPAICFGTGSTILTATGTGGLSPYSYLWNTGDTTANVTITAGGWYYVTVTDQSDAPCNTHTDSIFVDVFTLPILANAGPDIVACEKDTISLSGIVQIATGGYWSGGNGIFIPDDSTLITSYIPSVLEIANGSVTLYLTTTGNSSCPSHTDSILISFIKFDASIIVTPTSVSCFGGNNGSAIISLSGGTPPFTYTWNTVPVQTGNTATGLPAGTYTVNLSDGNGCDSLISVIISEPTVLIAVISDSTNISCTGGNNGTATVSASGGTGPYTYLWDANAGNQTDTTAVGLSVGSYNVVVTDSNGCTANVWVTITQPASAIVLAITTTDVTCFGLSDGTATATPSGGTPPYTYLWTPTGQTTITATNLAAGVYTVTVTDINGCVTQPGIIINEPSPLSASITFAPVSCFGGNNGTATVIGTGGISPYTYLWDANAGNQTTSTATGLSAGTYFVTTTDSNGCTFDTSVVISEPLLPISLLTSFTPVSCFGGNNGTATVIPSGGTSPYTYLWDVNAGNQTTSTATGLISGSYTVIVTDTNGCQDSVIVIVTQPLAPLSSLTNFTAVTCFGGNNGTATATPSGGTSPYFYLWDPNTGNQTTTIANGLIAGSYSVIITDTNGCIDTAFVTVTQPNLITVVASLDDTICPGGNATVAATVNGGNGGYVYNWNMGLPNSQTNIVNPTNTSTYVISVTDTFGCTGNTDSVTIYVLNLSPDSINALSAGDICEGGTTQVSGTYSAGIGVYTFSWNQGLGNGLGPFNVSPITTTTYIFTVTDQCNNSISDSVVVNVFPLPIINLPPIIAEGCEPLFVIFLDTLNDSTTVNYLWDFGDGFSSTYASVGHTYTIPGTYNVTLTITSNGGCVSTSTGNNVVIVNPSPTANGTASPFVTDMQNPTISFTDLSSGGITVLWDFGDGITSNINHPSHTYQDTGTYVVTITVTNQFGCTDIYQFTVVIEPFYTFVVPNAFTPNPGGGSGGQYDPTSLLNNVFYPFTEYVKEFRMRIFNRWGELIFESTDIKIGWDGYYRGVMAQQDVYVWQIDITYVDDKKLSKAGDLTLIR